PTSGSAMSAITRLREVHVPAAFAGTDAEVLVGGETAFNKDVFDAIESYTPIVFTFVLGLSFLLLMMAFRSIVVPLKAIVLNLLSVGAAYGLMVLVFQEGVGAQLFGFGQVEAIEAWLPLFLFSILFGLSMDYHVFLLSRIKERFDLTRDNTESVAYGLRTTGGLITGAAAIMVAVFGGFAAGDLVPLQQTGFGLAVAVLIDATLVRSILVPASMKLLGDRNWYFPRWLAWLPDISVEAPHTKTIEGPLVVSPATEG
ncbi:MAG TPA: MMPL family transporter, partial [Actinomycetota bacterium]|nr:MMPL family transporter [Actinomycetota bacterium]